MVGVIASYTPHLHHSPLDWCCMGLILLAFVTPAAVSRIRHELWRRRVLSAMR
ncbi:MAG TPA: hypothetical protein VE669_07770 [Actinomycetota bacterium]|jgi:hypothetical protein|nr:hypothetical protein [Actinomycetota bacterium]